MGISFNSNLSKNQLNSQAECENILLIVLASKNAKQVDEARKRTFNIVKSRRIFHGFVKNINDNVWSI